MIRLEKLHRLGVIADLDLHFAVLMTKLDGSNNPALALAAALASQRIGRGDVCLDLRGVAGTILGPPEASIQVPELETWIHSLRASPVVGEPGAFTPLVLAPGARLYLHRYWAYEQGLSEDLIRRLALPIEANEERLKEGLNRLFGPSADATDWQRVAAAVSALKRVVVISGGPGTGKTFTVLRILALLIDQAGPALRIALAAPTGKAAARLQETVRNQKAKISVNETVLQAIPDEASTLHRLLGARPGSTLFRYNQKNPLPVDVVVVDEASMVDLALLAKLVQALHSKARLILLGDHHQLASVEAGAVLGDLCGPNPEGFSPAFGDRLGAIIGQAMPIADGPLIKDSIVILKQSHRFSRQSGIGALAQAMTTGDGKEALAILKEKTYVDLALNGLDRGWQKGFAQEVVDGYGEYLKLVNRGATGPEIFAAFDRFRVLCAHRDGPYGVIAMNEFILAALRSQGLIRGSGLWYPGRPILITRNYLPLRLFNGDIGIALLDQGDLRVFFPVADGAGRRFPASRLPGHESVFAMTIHKSQGSEFDRVSLLLADRPDLLMTRELVYTGITRARQAVSIRATDEVILHAARTSLCRISGLKERLYRQ